MPTPNTVKLMVDGELEECLVRTIASEIHCKALSGRVFKFPVDVDLASAVKRHNKANGDKPVLATEVEEAADPEWDEWGA